MNDWKELEIDNLPSDILTGDYEFEGWKTTEPIKLISGLLNGVYCSIRYRKRQPKAPSHSEIMTKWWKDGAYWERVYRVSGGLYLMTGTGLWVGKKWFTGRESADIPPEAAE